MSTIDKFMDLFSDFNLVVQPRSVRPRETSPVDQSAMSRAELKKALKRLHKEYNEAKKAYKANKMTKQDLFDFEWRIFEIQEELNRLDDEHHDDHLLND